MVTVLELTSRMTGRLQADRVGKMTDSTNSSQFWPGDLIEQATGIIMNRFDLDAAQALEMLRKMSQNTRTQMCVVADQIINHNVSVEAVRGLEREYVRLWLVPETKR